MANDMDFERILRDRELDFQPDSPIYKDDDEIVELTRLVAVALDVPVAQVSRAKVRSALQRQINAENARAAYDKYRAELDAITDQCGPLRPVGKFRNTQILISLPEVLQDDKPRKPRKREL